MLLDRSRNAAVGGPLGLGEVEKGGEAGLDGSRESCAAGKSDFNALDSAVTPGMRDHR